MSFASWPYSPLRGVRVGFTSLEAVRLAEREEGEGREYGKGMGPIAPESESVDSSTEGLAVCRTCSATAGVFERTGCGFGGCSVGSDVRRDEYRRLCCFKGASRTSPGDKDRSEERLDSDRLRRW